MKINISIAKCEWENLKKIHDNYNALFNERVEILKGKIAEAKITGNDVEEQIFKSKLEKFKGDFFVYAGDFICRNWSDFADAHDIGDIHTDTEE